MKKVDPVLNAEIRWLKSHKKFYTYILKCDEVPFYVGKGRGGRMYRHEAEAYRRSLPVHCFIRHMNPITQIVQYEIVKFFDQEKEALDLESKLIKDFGRKDIGTGPLMNLTDGGLANAGRVPSKEWRRKKSLEMKRKLADPRNHPRYGVRTSKSTRQKISKSLTGKKASIETRQKMSLLRAGKKHPMSEEQKQKLSAIKTGKVSWAYQWNVTSPDGVQFVVYNLKSFCRKHGLNQGNMYQVAKGKKPSDKGWTCQKVSIHRFTVDEII